MTNLLPTAWCSVSLAEVLENSIGGVWGSDPGQDEVDVRVIRVTELKRYGRLEPSTAALRSINTRQLQKRQLRPGDLLLEKSGGGPKTPVGRVGLVQVVEDPTVCANFMQLMRPNPTLVLPRFLHLYLNHFHMQGGTLGMQNASTNIRNIKASEYITVAVPLPRLDEQRRIVDILEDHLSRLDAAGATLNSVSAKAAAFRDTILESAFFRRSDSFGITRATVGEVADVDSGPAFASSSFVGPDSGTRLLRGDNIEPGRLRWDRTKAWPDSHLDGYRHLLVVRGDIILAMDRPVVTAGLKLARVTEADMPALLVQRVARIRPNSAVDDDYLYQVLSSRRFVQQLLGAQVGTQIPHITLKSIRLFAFDLPDVAEQHAIAARVRAHIESADRVEHDTVVASKRSRSLRRALLAAAFSGRLTGRTSDMEMVEEMAGV